MLLLLSLVFLIPIAVYCLILSTLNRRPHPVMVSGVWDCVGLLFAAAGFFLGVLPGILAVLFGRTVRHLPLAQAHSGADAFSELVAEWWWAIVLYYALLATGAAVLLLSRRGKTVIYNVNPDEWEKAFAQVLAKHGLDQTRLGKQIVLGVPAAPEDAVTADPPHRLAAVLPDARPAALRTACLRVDAFPALSNITLHWESAAPELRDEIETDLDKALQLVETSDNVAGSWFLGIGSSIVTLVFLVLLMLVLFVYFPRR